MHGNDLILRATATRAPFRFVLINLTETANEIGKKHQARAHTLCLLAETAISSLLLSSGLKFAGTVSLHVDFSGDVSFVQSDSTPMGLVRAMIPFDEIAKAGDFELLLSPQRLKVRRLGEQGQLIQESVTEAASTRMGHNLAAFLLQSDQVRSAAGVYSKPNAQDDTKLDYAVGFLVEAFPDAEEKHLDILDMVVRDLPPLEKFATPEGFDLKKLLDQLAGPFETEIIREIIPEAYCPCSKERTLASLASFPIPELQSFIREGTDLELTCDYCRTSYHVTIDDLRNILAQRG